MLEMLSVIFSIGRGRKLLNKNNRGNFSGEKSTVKLSGVSLLTLCEKKLNVTLVTVLVLESKDLY